MLEIIRGYEPLFYRTLQAEEHSTMNAAAWDCYVHYSKDGWDDYPDEFHEKFFNDVRYNDDFQRMLRDYYLTITPPRYNAMTFVRSSTRGTDRPEFLEIPGAGSEVGIRVTNDFSLENGPLDVFLTEAQSQHPICVGPLDDEQLHATIYWYRNFLFRAPCDLTDEEVQVLADAEIIREDARLERETEERLDRKAIALAEAQAILSGEYTAVQSDSNGRVRPKISAEVQRFVWNRDGGRCVDCGSNERLEYDHIIPVSRGGSHTARNLQLLCETCNRRKGATIGGAGAGSQL